MLCCYTSFQSESQTECLDLHLPVHAPARLQPFQVSSTLSMLNMEATLANHVRISHHRGIFLSVKFKRWLHSVRARADQHYLIRCPSDEFGSSISSAIFLWASLVVIRCDQHVLIWLDLLALIVAHAWSQVAGMASIIHSCFMGKPLRAMYRAGHSFMKAKSGSVKVCQGITMCDIWCNMVKQMV